MAITVERLVIDVTTKTGKATADLTKLEAKVTLLTTKFMALGGAAGAAGGGLTALGSSAAALPGLLAGVGQGITAVIVAFQGVITAFQAFNKESKATAIATKQVSDSQKDAARAAKQVVKAQTALARAYEDAREGAEDAADRIKDAEKTLAQAQVNSRKAQENLTKAREAAVKNLEDLRRAASRMGLDEDQAAERIRQAQQELNRVLTDANATEEDRREASLNLRDAQADLIDVQAKNKDLAKELADAEKKGIKNSDAMTGAMSDQADATDALADARKALADAHRAQMRQQQDSAQAIVDAQDAIADAMENAAEASQKAADAQSGATSAFQTALKQLTPSAQEFVTLLTGMKPAFDEIKDAVQETFFKGMADSIKPVLSNYLPMLKDMLVDTAGVLNGALKKFNDLLISPKFMDQVKIIGDMNTNIVGDMADGIIDLADGITGFMIAAGPFTEWVSGGLRDAAGAFRDFTQSADGQKKIADFLADMKEPIVAIKDAVKVLVTDLLTLLQSVMPQVTQIFTTLSDTVIPALRDSLGKVLPVAMEVFDTLLTEASGLLGPLADALVPIGEALIEIWPKLADAIRPIIPPLGELVVALIDNLGPQLPEISSIMITLVEAFTDMLNVLGPLLPALLSVVDTLLKIPGVKYFAALGLIAGKLGLIGPAAKLAKKPLLDLVTKGFDKVAVGAYNLVGKLAGWGNAALSAMQPALMAFRAAFLTAMPWVAAAAAAAAVIYLIVRNWDTIKEFFSNLWKKIKVIFDKAWDWIFEKVRWVAKQILNLFLNWTLVGRLIQHHETIKRIFLNAWTWIKNMVSSVISWFAGIPKWIGDRLRSVGSVITNAFRGAWDWLSRTIGTVQGWFSNIPRNIATAFRYVADIISRPFMVAFNAIAKAWNATAGRLSFKAPSWVPGIGGKGFSMPQLPVFEGLAKGGIVGKKGNFWVGENGPELLQLPTGSTVMPKGRAMPLPDPRALHGGGGDTIVNNYIAGSVVTEKQLVERTRQALARDGRYNAGNTLGRAGAGR